MNNQIITIHKFTIDAGEYINSTSPEIPETIKTAIASQLFAHQISNKQAAIARVIPATDNNPSYSVVMLNKSATPDYYYSEGGDRLKHIIAFIEQHPDKLSNTSEPIEYNYSDLALEIDFPAWLNLDNLHGLIPPDKQVSLQQLNIWAHQKAENKPVAIAYQVKALAKPQEFILIYPASTQAYENIKTKLVAEINTKKVDKELVKLSVKSIANNRIIKPEAIEAIADALESQSLSIQDWENIFNSQGAEIGINESAYASNIMQVLTLRAMILPQSLWQYYQWYQKVSKKLSQHDLNNFFEFQKLLDKAFLDYPSGKQIRLFEEKLTEGVISLVIQLLDKKITAKELAKFLIKGSPWRQPLSHFFPSHLDKFGKKKYVNINKLPYGEKLFQDLIKYTSDSQPKPYYKPLAELFTLLEKYRLAAYFHQVSTGKVPRNVFNNAFNTERKKIIFYGLKIHPAPNHILNLIQLFIFGFSLYLVYILIRENLILLQQKKSLPQPTITETNIQPETPQQQVYGIPKEKMTEALNQFETTRETLKTMLKTAQNRDELIILLEDYTLNIDVIEFPFESQDEKEKWSAAIYKFQEKIGVTPDGIVSPTSETNKLINGLLNFEQTRRSIQSIINLPSFREQLSDKPRQSNNPFEPPGYQGYTAPYTPEEITREIISLIMFNLSETSLNERIIRINDSIDNNVEEKIQWIQTISHFQENKVKTYPNGIITIGDDTYRKLIESILANPAMQ